MLSTCRNRAGKNSVACYSIAVSEGEFYVGSFVLQQFIECQYQRRLVSVAIIHVILTCYIQDRKKHLKNEQRSRDAAAKKELIQVE